MKKTPMVTIYRGGKRIETYTDGGLDYIRRGGNTADMEDRCEWKDKV